MGHLMTHHTLPNLPNSKSKLKLIATNQSTDPFQLILCHGSWLAAGLPQQARRWAGNLQAVDEQLARLYQAAPPGTIFLVATQGDIAEVRHLVAKKQR